MSYEDKTPQQILREHFTRLEGYVVSFHRDMLSLKARERKNDRRYMRVIQICHAVIYVGLAITHWLTKPEGKLNNYLYWLIFSIVFFSATVIIELIRIRKRLEERDDEREHRKVNFHLHEN